MKTYKIENNAGKNFKFYFSKELEHLTGCKSKYTHAFKINRSVV